MMPTPLHSSFATLPRFDARSSAEHGSALPDVPIDLSQALDCRTLETGLQPLPPALTLSFADGSRFPQAVQLADGSIAFVAPAGEGPPQAADGEVAVAAAAAEPPVVEAAPAAADAAPATAAEAGADVAPAGPTEEELAAQAAAKAAVVQELKPETALGDAEHGLREQAVLPLLRQLPWQLAFAICDEFGSSALLLACHGGFKKVVGTLLRLPGPDPQELAAYCGRPNDLGWTPLLLAAAAGHKAICQVLLLAGVEANAASTGTRLTPLMMAAANGHTEVVDMLLDKDWAKPLSMRADPHLATIDGRTALDIVRERLRAFVRPAAEAGAPVLFPDGLLPDVPTLWRPPPVAPPGAEQRFFSLTLVERALVAAGGETSAGVEPMREPDIERLPRFDWDGVPGNARPAGDGAPAWAAAASPRRAAGEVAAPSASKAVEAKDFSVEWFFRRLDPNAAAA